MCFPEESLALGLGERQDEHRAFPIVWCIESVQDQIRLRGDHQRANFLIVESFVVRFDEMFDTCDYYLQ